MTVLERPLLGPSSPTDLEGRRARDRPGVEWKAYLAFLILMGASIPWRAKSYYEGGFDPVVAAKAALSLIGLMLALSMAGGRKALAVPAGPLVFALVYLSCTVLGAWAAGSLIPSAIVAIRVLILICAVLALRARFTGQQLVMAMVWAMGTFGLVGAVTGLPSWDGRLGGGIPPLHPNELALFCGVVTLACLSKVISGHDRLRDLVVALLAVTVLLATQSRTPVGALGVAVLALLVRTTAVRTRTLALFLLAVPVAAGVVLGTGVVTSFLSRDQDASQITTLSNRTIAWRAALGPQATHWARWLGGGLSMKRIPVVGQYWNDQILDSSWISALVQGGVLGIVVCLTWVVSTLVTVGRRSNPGRALQLSLVAFLVLRSFLESGLFDATTAFLMFFTLAVAPPVPRGTLEAEPD